jgi:acetylglutamate kinase
LADGGVLPVCRVAESRLDAIRKADVLVEALGWIRQFRGRYVVIKLGGSALEESAAVRSVLTDVIFLSAVGMKPILVHGGGKSITQAMTAAGIEPKFVSGRRYTDERTLEIVAKTLAGEICGSLVAEIKQQNGEAVGLSYLGQNCLIGKKLSLNGSAGAPVDLGRVGEVVDIDRGPIEEAFAAGAIPVIPSIALDAAGGKLNVNADTAAAAVARFLGAEKLVFLSDVPGIFRDRHDPSTLISHLPASLCRGLIVEGVIDAGMVPKVEAALEALQSGVRKVHIVDAAMPHAVLLEFYSDSGVGTEIVP